MNKQPYYKEREVDSVMDMLKKKAEEVPDKEAFIFDNGSATYKEVYETVCKGIKCFNYVNKHFAIIGENSYEWIIAYFTVVASGNVAVPINKDFTPAEMSEIIKQFDIDFVFISESAYKRHSEVIGSKYELLKDFYDNAIHQPLIKPRQIDGDRLASIFLTSGTTGKNKGVMFSQSNIGSQITQVSNTVFYDLVSTVATLPFYHTLGLNVGVFMAYNCNTKVFINSDTNKLLDDIKAAKPRTLVLVPLHIESFYKKIMYEIKTKNLKTNEEIVDIFGGNLDTIMTGGSGLDDFYIEEFKNFGINIFFGYGATECFSAVTSNTGYNNRKGSVGVPYPNMQIRTTSDGEIIIKGPSVMMGYYKDEKSTNDVLRNGWFYTGDIGYIDEDGFVFITGRQSNLIILSNGENVSPEEIENLYLKDDAVEEVVVCEDNNMIVAKIYPVCEESISKVEYFNELKHKINADLPMYKRVSKVILRDTPFARNSVGKIIR